MGLSRPPIAFVAVLLASLTASLAAPAGAGEPAHPGVRLSPAAPGATTAPNPAGLTIEFAQGNEVNAGERVVIVVSSKKPGYLILLDVDAGGKTQQIYPNLQSMRMPKGAGDDANRIRPGKPVRIPDPLSLIANFEFVAEQPLGPGMIVALMSPRPVQLVDLPDVPADALGSPAAVDFIYAAARELRIAGRDEAAPLLDPQWSLAAQFYYIR